MPGLGDVSSDLERVATPSSRDGLVALLVATYPELKRRLAGRLGSIELASDALQDTYMRLHRADDLGEVRNPKSYLFRMAINIASNNARSEARHLSTADVETLIGVRDQAPGPMQIAEGRSELAAVQRAIEALPIRRRAIFRRIWVDRIAFDEIALEFNVSVRTIRYELLLATRHLHSATQNFCIEGLQKRLADVSS